jgi:hypothetical protein
MPSDGNELTVEIPVLSKDPEKKEDGKTEQNGNGDTKGKGKEDAKEEPEMVCYYKLGMVLEPECLADNNSLKRICS